jgi:hypothetical protein
MCPAASACSFIRKAASVTLRPDFTIPSLCALWLAPLLGVHTPSLIRRASARSCGRARDFQRQIPEKPALKDTGGAKEQFKAKAKHLETRCEIYV